MFKLHWSTLVAFLLFSASTWAQQPALTAEQVLDRYGEAVGGIDKFNAISTWQEKWEITGDLTDYVPQGRAPTPFKSHGGGEFYYKAPNFRVQWVQSDKKDFMSASGCDGKEAWVYTPMLGMLKRKAKPGQDYGCYKNMWPLPIWLLQEKAKLELRGHKDIGGRPTYVIGAQLPDRRSWSLYFDSDSYMLLKVESHRQWHLNFLYSDYRDVGGIKMPFRIERQTDNTNQIIRVLDVQMNVPIDDQVFRRPKW